MPTSGMPVESAELSNRAPPDLDSMNGASRKKVKEAPAVSSSRENLPCNQDDGYNLDDLGAFCIEICSGTAGLTASLRKVGFINSFGVDHIVKSGCRAPVVKVDIASNLDLVKSWLSHRNCLYIHLGVPCGTASRAREIFIPNGPVPLRTEAEPDGIASLTGRNKERVDLANSVYCAACTLILFAHEMRKHWSIENPTRSLFWLTSYWRSVTQVVDPMYVSFHNCMWGGARPKKTTLATSVLELGELACECDGQHTHLPWGRTPFGFATADEVEYPLALCNKWASIIHDALKPHLQLSQQTHFGSPDKKARTSTGKQTKRSPAMIRDYHEVQTVTLPSGHGTLVAKHKLTSPIVINESVTIPVHARILRVTAKGGDQSDSKSFEVAFGNPWDETSFIQEAVRKGHPSNLFEGIPQTVCEAIWDNVRLDPHALVKRRASWLKKWLDRAMELRDQEASLHKQLPRHRRAILQGKRFLVLKEILAEEGYPDLGLVDEMINGFELVGVMNESAALPPDFQPAVLTVDDLLTTSEPSNKAIIHSTKSSGSELIDSELFAKTREEVEKGWLEGPVSGFDVRGRVSRRFAVVQSDKVRPVDNYSESQVNDAVTITNRCTVDGVDSIAATVVAFVRDLHLKGKKREGVLGMTFDLKSAYRQLAVADGSLRWARLAVYNPHEQSTELYQQYSLPFGARASVIAFIRCARMIQWLALRLGIVSTSYFDDFVVLSRHDTASNTERSFACLLDLLGWKYDQSGDKADTMSTTVKALGVLFDLAPSIDGCILVCNTEKRKKELAAKIEDVLREGSLSAPAAASLKGRLGFAEGQLFGRATRKLLNELGHHAIRTPPNGKLSEATKFALRFVGSRILESRDRVVKSTSAGVFFMFTDASFASDSKTGGLGGVLLDATGRVLSWFGYELDEAFCSSVMVEGQEQVIGELETQAVLAGFKLWHSYFSSMHVVSFIDNEAARICILKGYSKNTTISQMAHAVSLLEEECCCFPWYARVPSEANIADPPSRSVEHELLCQSLRCQLPELKSLWLS